MNSATFNEGHWSQFNSRYQGKFFNSLIGPRPLTLVGTTDKDGVNNLSLINSIIHVGANPPLIGFVLRPTSVPRHTYDNIKATGDYTINMVTESMLDKAHQASAKYPSESDEFFEVGLTPHYSEPILAPYVEESPVKIGLRFKEEHLIKANATRVIIGSVVSVTLPESTISSDGRIDTSALDTILAAGLDAYHGHSFKRQIPYATP